AHQHAGERHPGENPCMACHMPQPYRNSGPLSFRIANIEDSRYPAVDHRAPDDRLALRARAPYSRHTLVGLNLFVMAMFQQFPALLRLETNDINVPGDTASRLRVAAADAA